MPTEQLPDDRFPELSAAVAAALESIALDPDDEHAYHRATALGMLGRELLDDARKARGVALGRVRARTGWRYDEIGFRLGICRSRVSQLINLGKGKRAA